MEASKVWNFCVEAHKQARREHRLGLERVHFKRLPKADNSRCILNRCNGRHAFLANIDTTRKLRQTHPQIEDEISIARKMLLSGQMACSGRQEEAWTRYSAHGQWAQAYHPASRLA